MKRTFTFDDEQHRCLFIEKGQPFIVSQEGLENPLIFCAFDLRTLVDIEKAESVLEVCRKLIEIGMSAPRKPEQGGM